MALLNYNYTATAVTIRELNLYQMMKTGLIFVQMVNIVIRMLSPQEYSGTSCDYKEGRPGYSQYA